MNQRIKELAAQAYANERLSYEPSWKPNPVSEVLLADLQEVFEEFAKLIVQECADAIIEDSRLKDVRNASNGCVRTIREHFGIEP